MIHVGIIGLGPAWDARYLPALRNLGRRIRVRAVYDPVATRAEIAAAELSADPAAGLRALLDRRDVRAVLLLDNGWQADFPLGAICERRIPAYIAGSVGENLTALRRLHELACSHSVPLMPEFSRRFNPATGRLQELMATRLGRPQRIEIDATLPDPQQSPTVPGQGAGVDFLVGLLDWCRYVARTPPQSVHARRLTGDDLDLELAVEFRRPRAGGEPVAAVVRLHRPMPGDGNARFESHIVCQGGEATLGGATSIRWTSGTETADESLTSERSEVEVMLDHFCRRVAGGLIPVADVEDVCRSLELAAAAEASLTRGEPVEIAGP